TPAGQHDAAPDVVGAGAELLWRADRLCQCLLGRCCRIPFALVGLLAVQARDWQGRYGPWGFQVACRAWSLAWVAVAASGYSDFVTGWGHCWHQSYGVQKAWAGGAYSFRALSGSGRGGLLVVWWRNSDVLVWVSWSLIRVLGGV